MRCPRMCLCHTLLLLQAHTPLPTVASHCTHTDGQGPCHCSSQSHTMVIVPGGSWPAPLYTVPPPRLTALLEEKCHRVPKGRALPVPRASRPQNLSEVSSWPMGHGCGRPALGQGACSWACSGLSALPEVWLSMLSPRGDFCVKAKKQEELVKANSRNNMRSDQFLFPCIKIDHNRKDQAILKERGKDKTLSRFFFLLVHYSDTP